ncbi:PTS sugar transporter subunit IIA [Agrilactobacillus yilanensis]|uniref:PTS sugar transporter subunit IIA n=1 Tax=Agrilactobacillus yilanensis TaxID=2485997 RepID=A0ABW4J5U2_9LACO|nr:PTS sugar transporter subunit IIA [Agrilactobacillus yilanensis]
MNEVTVKSVFDPKIVDLNINAKTKDEVIKHLAELLVKEGYVTDINAYTEDIYHRESQGITGMGDNIAIPHGKSSAVVKTGLAIGKTNQMIPWESYDEKPVNIIFLFAVADKKSDDKTHLRLLADVATRLGNEETLKQVKQAKDVMELHRALFL